MQNNRFGNLISGFYHELPVVPTLVDGAGKVCDSVKRNSVALKRELLSGLNLCVSSPDRAFTVKAVGISALGRFCSSYAGTLAQKGLQIGVDTAVHYTGRCVSFVCIPVGFITQYSPLSIPGWGLVKSVAGGIASYIGSSIQPLLPAAIGNTIQIGGYAADNVVRLGTTAIGVFGLWHAGRAAYWAVRQNPLSVKVLNAGDFSDEHEKFQEINRVMSKVRQLSVAFGVTMVVAGLISYLLPIYGAEPFGYAGAPIEAGCSHLFTATALRVGEYALLWVRNRTRTLPSLGEDLSSAARGTVVSLQKDGVLSGYELSDYQADSSRKIKKPEMSKRLLILEKEQEASKEQQDLLNTLTNALAEAQNRVTAADGEISSFSQIPTTEATPVAVKNLKEKNLKEWNDKKEAARKEVTQLQQEIGRVNQKLEKLQKSADEYERLCSEYKKAMDDYYAQMKSEAFTPAQKELQVKVARQLILYGLRSDQSALVDRCLASKKSVGSSSFSIKNFASQLSGAEGRFSSGSRQTEASAAQVVALSDTKFAKLQDQLQSGLDESGFRKWMSKEHPDISLEGLDQPAKAGWKAAYEAASGESLSLLTKIDGWAQKLVQSDSGVIHKVLDSTEI